MNTFYLKSPVYTLVIMSLLSTLAGCVQFKTAQLYDGTEPKEVFQLPADISLIVEPTIFYDDAKDVWGLEKEDCKYASLDNKVVYSGNESIKIEWNRDAGCKWAGIGIGWDGYAGKDLSAIMDAAAIEFFVRSEKGRMFGLPFVLAFEDYSGGMGFCYTANKYFERTAIDTVWQRVVVPLADFDLKTENLDPSNIKQLQIELQQSGNVYIDDIKLIYFTPEPVKPWMQEESLPDPLAMPVTIFSDEFKNNNSWGIFSSECHKVEITNQEKSSGNSSIHATWDFTKNNCAFNALGASWNKWRPIDMTEVRSNAAINFQIKFIGSASQDVFVGLQDYDKSKSEINLKTLNLKPQIWNDVTIPLQSLDAGKIKFSKIKDFVMHFEGKGEVFIDDIKLVSIRQ